MSVQLVDYSTDGEGFLLSLRHQGGMEPVGKKVVLLGVGGAARALAFRLAQERAAALYLVGRNPEKTAALQAALRDRIGFTAVGLTFTKRLGGCGGGGDLVIDPDHFGDVSGHCRRPSFRLVLPSQLYVVADLVYHPLETAFLRYARRLGLPTLEGLGMLVYQGILACRLWTGLTPPFDPLYRLLHGLLQKELPPA